MYTPCDNGDCPYNATGGYDCRNYCGLGADEDTPTYEYCVKVTKEDGISEEYWETADSYHEAVQMLYEELNCNENTQFELLDMDCY